MIRFLRSVPVLDEGCGYEFPSPDEASEEGIVCVGGNLSPGVLLSAYRQGIFPWYGENEPILWYSPDPRFVLLPETLHVSDTSRKLLKKQKLRLSLDEDFASVIGRCANAPRPGQSGTWIVPEMITAYRKLHELGFAHSVEVWDGHALVGGLYGIGIGNAFFGESMFSGTSGASRIALLSLAAMLFENGFKFIDSQVYTDYVAGMGAVEIPRKAYLHRLSKALQAPSRRGKWSEAFPRFPVSDAMLGIIGGGKENRRKIARLKRDSRDYRII